MKKFEYKVLEIPSKGLLGYKVDYISLASTLNELGSKGWEVVSMNATPMSSGTSHGVIILKREMNH
jgi:hypothetical protein